MVNEEKKWISVKSNEKVSITDFKSVFEVRSEWWPVTSILCSQGIVLQIKIQYF